MNLNIIEMAHQYEKETYPIFLECCKYIKDDFWLNIFKDMAKGKMPYGIHVSESTTLTTHYKNKNFNYIYIDKDPETIFKELKELYVENFGLRSELDNNKYKVKLNKNLKNITDDRDTNWKSIKRISIQNTLLINYIIKIKNKYSMTNETAQCLLNSIKNSLSLKILISDDIILKLGKIQEILYINYDTDTFQITSTRISKKAAPTKTVKNLMFYHWIKSINKTNQKDV